MGKIDKHALSIDVTKCDVTYEIFQKNSFFNNDNNNKKHREAQLYGWKK